MLTSKAPYPIDPNPSQDDARHQDGTDRKGFSFSWCSRLAAGRTTLAIINCRPRIKPYRTVHSFGKTASPQKPNNPQASSRLWIDKRSLLGGEGAEGTRNTISVLG